MIGLLVSAAVVALSAPALGRTSGWSVVPSANAGTASDINTLAGVSCVSATACTAVGYYSNSSFVARTLIEARNGTSWSVKTSPNAGSASDANLLGAVSCVSATACTAVGHYTNSSGVDKTLIEAWNGTSWSVKTSPNAGSASTANRLAGVSCVSATACTAVGYYTVSSSVFKTLIEAWNGTSWSVKPSPNAGPTSDADFLGGVSCVSATACTAVGAYGNYNLAEYKTLIEAWNGTSWSVKTSPNAGSASNANQLEGVSCVSATACTAAGEYVNSGGVYRTLIEAWNGTSWSVKTSPNTGTARTTNYLAGVSCVSATACTAAGHHLNSSGAEKTLIEAWNGTSWAVVPSPNAGSASNSNVLQGVSCMSATACTAAGYYTNSSDVQKTLIESS